MLVDVIGFIFGIIIVVIAAMCVMVSSDIIDERKRKFREGTHDYYGNKIEDEVKNNDYN